MKKIDCVLIDDDELVQLIWRLSAQTFNVYFIGFKSLKDFLNHYHCFSMDIPIYIDLKLGNSFCGDQIAQKIYELGFKKIYISTGFSGFDLSHLTFLAGVVGKEPVWL